MHIFKTSKISNILFNLRKLEINTAANCTQVQEKMKDIMNGNKQNEEN
jgi:hypothetical protein